jgi:large subunit ribosomal protein L4
MVAIPVYDLSGNKTREVEVDADTLDTTVRRALLKEALIAYNASQRQGSASTKTRGEVQGGSAKPWRQKGTGRARHGSIRSPIFVGGGRAHGPKPRDFSYRLPTKQRRLATRSALRYRLEGGAIKAVEGLAGLESPKTRTVAKFLNGQGLEGKGILLVSEGDDKNLHLSVRNIQKLDMLERRSLNAGQILRRPNLVFTVEALDALTQEVSA